MPKIIQLDRHVADLIAAGEVVERPASCVKELVENAVDAGAKHITVEIQNGGMRFIRITDDGCGMSLEDARTAFLRHATSKIRTKDDLAAITTLGFRGEALAAISAVSRIDLLTKAAGSDGVSLHLDAGVITNEQAAGCPDGTTIIVRDLFYNTPARMKFMKSDTAEGSAVTATVQQQALAHPDAAIRLIRDGQEVFATSGDGDRMAAIYVLFGRELANGMVAVNGHWEKIHVRGFVTKPTATRGNRTYQQFFVNGRFVKSRMLSTALEESYKNQIMVGRFPACVLEVELPAEAVDVNVHPAKTEVKFLYEKQVFDAVHYAVLSTLGKTSARPEMKLPEKKQAVSGPTEPVKPAAPAAPAVKPTVNPNFYKAMQAEEYRRLVSQESARKAVPVVAQTVQIPTSKSAVSVPAPQEKTSSQQSFILPAEKPKAEVPAEPIKEKSAAAPAVSEKPAAVCEEPAQQELSLQEQSYRIVGEVLDTYIIVEQGETVLFIDKHAAHERINFEKLKAEDHPIMSQLLLTPVRAELSCEEAAAVLEQKELLSRCGFEVEDFGDGDVLIRQVPADTKIDDAAALLQKLAADLLAGKALDPDGLRDALLHTIACKAAIKAGWHTEAEEREYLVREVLSRDDIKYCPHGRPVCIQLTKKQLEKQFKRA
ncbi:MAG: DNA mismatch repair endonuclease MutL [Clostridia bacterium]|nr:DNA mismatch repair endonuclease MutL [Clostridia bacterium]